MGDLMMARRRILLEEPQLKSASGNPAVFFADRSAPMGRLQVSFSPQQAGSGTPTPSNPRRISGFDRMTVLDSGETIATVVFPASVGTQYAGTVDLISGAMTVTHVLVNLEGLSWTKYGTQNNDNGTIFTVSTSATLLLAMGEARALGVYSNLFVLSSNGSYSTSGADTIWWARTSGYRVVTGGARGAMSLADFQSLIQTNGLQLCAPLYTQQTYQLGPRQINALRGLNSLSCAGPVELTYWTH